MEDFSRIVQIVSLYYKVSFKNMFFWLVCFLIGLFFSGYGRRDVVEFLLMNGACIQARDDGGLHPLHNACSFGHSDVVRLLLEAGANPNTRDNWNYTPLHEAAIKVIFFLVFQNEKSPKLFWFLYQFVILQNSKEFPSRSFRFSFWFSQIKFLQS